jgi:small subunit ribosomal protein S20
LASHASAVKKQRRDDKARLHNRALRSRYRTQIKKIRALIESGDLAGAKKILPGTLSLVDRSAKLGVIHDNTAARAKSRLMLAPNHRPRPSGGLGPRGVRGPPPGAIQARGACPDSGRVSHPPCRAGLRSTRIEVQANAGRATPA